MCGRNAERVDVFCISDYANIHAFEEFVAFTFTLLGVYFETVVFIFRLS